MKNILIISALFPPEPVVSAKISYDLANEIYFKHGNLVVIAPPPSRPKGFVFQTDSFFSFNIIRSNTYYCSDSNIVGRLKESYSFGKFCENYIKNNHKNISQIYANTWPLLAQYYAVRVAKKYDIPIYIHVQDIYPESLINKVFILGCFIKKTLLPVDKYILKNASKIIVISEKMKENLCKTRNLDVSKMEVILNWQDESEFQTYKNSLNLKVNERNLFTFMYLGNIGPVASIDLLVAAFLRANLPATRLVIAGAGSMKQNIEQIVKKENSNQIEFWDVPEGKVPEIQDMADVLLLPMKKGEGVNSIPSKLPAYMFSEKPIIALVDLNSDISLIIKKANCGWVVNSEIELINVMKYAFNIKKDKLIELGKNGNEYALQHFSKKSNLNKLMNIFIH
jgi:glycosyltransferase involved in cell wall biosynthesis